MIPEMEEETKVNTDSLKERGLSSMSYKTGSTHTSLQHSSGLFDCIITWAVLVPVEPE